MKNGKLDPAMQAMLECMIMLKLNHGFFPDRKGTSITVECQCRGKPTVKITYLKATNLLPDRYKEEIATAVCDALDRIIGETKLARDDIVDDLVPFLDAISSPEQIQRRKDIEEWRYEGQPFVETV